MKLRITLEDKSYEVAVEVLPETEAEPASEEAPESVPLSVLQPPRADDTMAEDKICRSPIAGMIVAVKVSANQWVRQDEPVAIIEARKMQNAIGAPLEGLVEEILVKAGETVKPGQMICKLS